MLRSVYAFQKPVTNQESSARVTPSPVVVSDDLGRGANYLCDYMESIDDAISYLDEKLKFSKADVHNVGSPLLELQKYINKILSLSPIPHSSYLIQLEHFKTSGLVTSTRDFIMISRTLELLNSLKKTEEEGPSPF